MRTYGPDQPPKRSGRTVPLGELCPRCGQVHTRCAGHKKRITPLVPCMKWPDKALGVEVCSMHGGRTEKAKQGGRVRLAYQAALGEVGQMLNDIDVPAPPDPLAALDFLLDRAWRNTYVLGLLVGELDVGTEWGWKEVIDAKGAMQRFVVPKGSGAPVPVGDGGADDDEDPDDAAIAVVDQSQAAPGLIGPDHQGNQRTNVLWTMYGIELDRYARLVKIAIDTGHEERRVAAEEREAQAFLGAVLLGLQDEGVDSPAVRTAIANRLRALTAGTLEIGAA